MSANAVGPKTTSFDVPKIVDSTTLHNKVIAGYQGWFSTVCDDGLSVWKNWDKDVKSRNLNQDEISFNMWPYMNDFDADELCDTGLVYQNIHGTNNATSKAGLFSTFSSKTVQRHVQWMHQYGIDGVFVQRVVSKKMSPVQIEDKKILHMAASAEKFGRVFATMFDISGYDLDDESLSTDIKSDWMHMVDNLNVTTSTDRYLKHNGKPLVALRGFGFTKNVGGPSMTAELINWFQHSAEEKYRATLLGSVPTHWRSLANDSKTDDSWGNVYRSFDIVSPWSVGHYDTHGLESFVENYLKPDASECQKHNVEYMPVVYPGFSGNSNNPDKSLDQIGRMGGNFLWQQFYQIANAGISSSMVYVAMFDGVNDGTAIFKIAENASQVPATRNNVFKLTLDYEESWAPCNDWYMLLVGYATSLLRYDLDNSSMKSFPRTMPDSLQSIIGEGNFDSAEIEASILSLLLVFGVVSISFIEIQTRKRFGSKVCREEKINEENKASIPLLESDDFCPQRLKLIESSLL